MTPIIWFKWSSLCNKLAILTDTLLTRIEYPRNQEHSYQPNEVIHDGRQRHIVTGPKLSERWVFEGFDSSEVLELDEFWLEFRHFSRLVALRKDGKGRRQHSASVIELEVIPTQYIHLHATVTIQARKSTDANAGGSVLLYVKVCFWAATCIFDRFPDSSLPWMTRRKEHHFTFVVTYRNKFGKHFWLIQRTSFLPLSPLDKTIKILWGRILIGSHRVRKPEDECWENGTGAWALVIDKNTKPIAQQLSEGSEEGKHDGSIFTRTCIRTGLSSRHKQQNPTILMIITTSHTWYI
jgi:hypothetical protein